MAPIAHIGLSSATPLSPQDMNRERSTLTGPSRVVESIPPGAGALVMGTGIISIDLALLGQQPLSLVPLVVAGVAWVALGLLMVAAAMVTAANLALLPPRRLSARRTTGYLVANP
jgi:hypothetical protein